MLSEKMTKELNKQVNAEFYSSYLYLSMSAYCNSIGLSGFASWMKAQADEEKMHTMKIYDYILERGEKVILTAIAKPQTSWNGAIEVFEETLKHEQYVTSLINNLADIAMDERDHATLNFLQWFISEQVEEEATVGDLLDKIKLTGEDGNGIFMLDKEASTRVFTPPVV